MIVAFRAVVSMDAIVTFFQIVIGRGFKVALVGVSSNIFWLFVGRFFYYD